MSLWKCREALASLAGLAASALLSAAVSAQAILPPDAAARAFEAGRSAALRGDYLEAVKPLHEALQTGHTRPEERLGTSRNFTVRYDPDYWLGVAYMELGENDAARKHLLRSRENGLIQGWPELSDLRSRLAVLERRAADPTPTAPPE